jgi:hypothetical protein
MAVSILRPSFLLLTVVTLIVAVWRTVSFSRPTRR